jgi:hypothetical protein
MKNAEAPVLGQVGLARKRESGRNAGNDVSITDRKKALKGEAHERGRLKETFEI